MRGKGTRPCLLACCHHRKKEEADGKSIVVVWPRLCNMHLPFFPFGQNTASSSCISFVSLASSLSPRKVFFQQKIYRSIHLVERALKRKGKERKGRHPAYASRVTQAGFPAFEPDVPQVFFFLPRCVMAVAAGEGETGSSRICFWGSKGENTIDCICDVLE